MLVKPVFNSVCKCRAHCSTETFASDCGTGFHRDNCHGLVFPAEQSEKQLPHEILYTHILQQLHVIKYFFF